MSAEAAMRWSWPVGRFTASLSAARSNRGGLSNAVIEWVPETPSRLTTAEIRQYRQGRDDALRELATALGSSIAVIET